ncbi:MAG: VOC family protein [Saprospiraceae bacterium]|nr:VOC family protein [Saprospiraceae bacterium]
MNLNQITVPSLNLETSISFYEMLGLRLIVKAMPHYARFECPDGEATFSIHLVDEITKGEGIYVYFEVVNLDQQVTQLKEKGIKFELEPTDQPWLWREARLRDPDGNQLVLFYGGNNRLNPPWRIDNES